MSKLKVTVTNYNAGEGVTEDIYVCTDYKANAETGFLTLTNGKVIDNISLEQILKYTVEVY